ncbi:MAG: nuclear transport factor 2 family protein [Ktedonobacterales bacterium]
MEQSQELLDLYRQVMTGGLRDTPSDQVTSTTPALSMFGTDPTEWWTDRATIVQMFDAQRQAEDQAPQIIPGNPQAWVEGDLGWVVDQPRLRLPNGAEVQLRSTSIFHREGGTWKLVHGHASIGVPNDQIEAFRLS